MTSRQASFLTVLLLFFTSVNVIAQHGAMLPRSVPETEGVSSGGIMDFLNAASKSKTEFHSFMLLRHGKVIAEGWWHPYGPRAETHFIFLQQKFYSHGYRLCLTGKAAFP